MKKLIVFVLLLVVLSSTVMYKQEINPVWGLSNIQKVCFVSKDKFEQTGFENVICGDLFFNFCSSDVAKNDLKNYQAKSLSIQLYFENAKLNNLIKTLKIDNIKEEILDNVKVLTGYSPYFQDSILFDGKKINVQIGITQNLIILGNPLIFTGF